MRVTIQRLGSFSFMSSLLFFLALVVTTPSPLDASSVEGQVTVRGARDNSNAVVYIDRIPGKRFSPPATPVSLDQVNLTFIPHVLPVLAGTTVAFPNSDEIRHNVFSPSPAKFNLGTYPRTTTKYRLFDKPGPVTLLCNVHAEMSAYVFVTETPYFYRTDKDGKFTLTNVPPGRYLLKAWHERTKTATIEIEVLEHQTVKINFELRK
jgi:plastocyanin